MYAVSFLFTGLDYTANSGTLTFNPGNTQLSVPIQVLDDNAVNEPANEILTVTLSNPTNATLGSPSTATINSVEDSDSGVGAPLPSGSVGQTFCNCGCPGQEGSTVQPNPQSLGPVLSQSTLAPVRYGDGVASIAATDLHSEGSGFDWGQTRSWSSGTGYATGSVNGTVWVDTYIPHLIQADGSTANTLVVLLNSTTAYYYDLVGNEKGDTVHWRRDYRRSQHYPQRRHPRRHRASRPAEKSG
jgi:hypothetical protein